MSENTPETLDEALRLVPPDILTDPGRIQISWRTAAYLVADGTVTVRNIFRGESCVASRLLDVAGTAVTGDDGTVEISLNSRHCLDTRAQPGSGGLQYDDPASVVATVHGDQPALVAAQTRTGPGADDRPSDLFLTLRTWGVDGAALPGVRVYWRVLVPTSTTIS